MIMAAERREVHEVRRCAEALGYALLPHETPDTYSLWLRESGSRALKRKTLVEVTEHLKLVSNHRREPTSRA